MDVSRASWPRSIDSRALSLDIRTPSKTMLAVLAKEPDSESSATIWPRVRFQGASSGDRLESVARGLRDGGRRDDDVSCDKFVTVLEACGTVSLLVISVSLRITLGEDHHSLGRNDSDPKEQWTGRS